MRSRLRRSSGVERLQLRWLVYAAVLIPGSVGVCLVEVAVTGDDGEATTAAIMLTLIAIPAAIAVAVMRYRLYEIDRLINRTLVYAALTAGLAATFAAVSLTLGVAIGGGSTVPTATATLAVALAFGPLRSRLQVTVDRRFDRARYEGLRLRDGTLTLHAVTSPGSSMTTGTVTGGTGAYANARGLFHSEGAPGGAQQTITLAG